MPLVSDLTVNFNVQQSSTLDLASGLVTMQRQYRTLLQNGTAAGQADRFFQDTRTVAASTNDDLDLAGVLTDAYGVTITFARIKGLFVAAAAANANNVIIGGSATNPVTSFMSGTTPAIILRPGASMMLTAGSADATGYAVTAGTADILRLTNGGAGTTVTYDIVIIGASA
jgi:hypothetical protein